MKTKLFKSKFLTRLAISYSLVLILIVSAFTIILYQMTEDKRRNTTMLDQQELMAKTISQLDSYLKSMDGIALRVVADTEIVLFFNELSQKYDSSNYFKTNVMEAIDISSILKTINGPSEPMWRISVYNQYGDYISTGAIPSDNNFIASKLSKMNVVEDMVNLVYSGGANIMPPTDDRWSDFHSSSYISVLRPVMNANSKKAYAVVEIQQDVSKLESILEFQSTDNMQLRIYNKKNELIFPKKEDETYDRDDVYITTAVSDISGWTVELTRKKQEKYTEIVVAFSVIYLVLIFFIITISYIIAQRITRPLRELRKSVNKISAHNIAIKLDGNQVIDEIKDLSDSFSDVLLRMGESAKHEKKAYSLALQSQMNPHFLFNTLAVISATGMEAGNEKVVNMCQQVSDMLRYVASYETSVVPFCDETTHAMNYLELMKARYEDCFYYDIVINEEINNVLVPKLILQPLLENCFNHAFRDTEPPWKVHIEVGIVNGRWHMQVEDNGIGIPIEQINKIQMKIEQYSQNITENYKELKIGGLGLVSIITRLKLVSNEDVNYTIGTGALGGTIIRIEGEVTQGL